MKKDYIQPYTESVNVRLNSSVLQNNNDIPVVNGSFYTDQGLGKKADLDFDDLNSEEDIWGGQNIQMKDVWER